MIPIQRWRRLGTRVRAPFTFTTPSAVYVSLVKRARYAYATANSVCSSGGLTLMRGSSVLTGSAIRRWASGFQSLSTYYLEGTS